MSPTTTTTPLLTSIDDTIESCISGPRITQLLPSLLVALAWAFDAQQTFISVFTDKEPTWRCLNPNDEICASSPSPCNLNWNSWTWEPSSESSVVSEWNLLCEAPALASLPATAFFVGCLVGGLLLSTLADSILGRKRLLVLSSLATSITGLLTIFSPNIWVYITLRFISGFARSAISTSVLVLATEIVSKKWRDTVSIFCFVFCNFGFLSLPIIAYLCRMLSWRYLYFWTSVPSFCYAILVHFVVQESPRWLLIRGRKDEAIKTLKNISALSGNLITSSFSELQFYDESTHDTDLLSIMRMLWERKWARQRLTTIMIASIGVGIVYYGMPLNVGNLSSSLYLSLALNALAEFPSSLATFFLVGKINRRSSLLVFTTISGISCLLCVFDSKLVPERVQISIEVISFFSACTAFNIVLVYSIELFPTCVRNSALALVRQAVVLGGVLAPVLVVQGRKNKFWSFGVFGLVIITCSLFVIRLPETRGRSMCDTMEEEESIEVNKSEDCCILA